MTDKSRFGFTLAEVLITLGVIGVVAAITIPTLMSAHRERVNITQLKKTHSLLSEAFKLAVAENGEIEGWDIGTYENNYNSSAKLFSIVKPYLKLSEDCGKQGCFSSKKYKALNGKTDFSWQPNTHPVYYKSRLLNGTSLAFWSAGYCHDNGGCGTIFVDVNGDAPPNQAGIDYFRFDIMTNGIHPATSSTKATQYGLEICAYNNSSGINGATCTKWAIMKGNFDYLKRDVSAEMSKL